MLFTRFFEPPLSPHTIVVRPKRARCRRRESPLHPSSNLPPRHHRASLNYITSTPSSTHMSSSPWLQHSATAAPTDGRWHTPPSLSLSCRPRTRTLLSFWMKGCTHYSTTSRSYCSNSCSPGTYGLTPTPPAAGLLKCPQPPPCGQARSYRPSSCELAGASPDHELASQTSTLGTIKAWRPRTCVITDHCNQQPATSKRIKPRGRKELGDLTLPLSPSQQSALSPAARWWARATVGRRGDWRAQGQNKAGWGGILLLGYCTQ